MNKKGDITIAILVIGIVGICFFTLLTFLISNTSISNNFDGVKMIENVNLRAEKGDPYDGQIPKIGKNYFEKRKEEGGTLWRYRILFEVKYIIP